MLMIPSSVKIQVSIVPTNICTYSHVRKFRYKKIIERRYIFTMNPYLSLMLYVKLNSYNYYTGQLGTQR